MHHKKSAKRAQHDLYDKRSIIIILCTLQSVYKNVCTSPTVYNSVFCSYRDIYINIINVFIK